MLRLAALVLATLLSSGCTLLLDAGDNNTPEEPEDNADSPLVDGGGLDGRDASPDSGLPGLPDGGQCGPEAGVVGGERAVAPPPCQN